MIVVLCVAGLLDVWQITKQTISAAVGLLAVGKIRRYFGDHGNGSACPTGCMCVCVCQYVCVDCHGYI